MASSWGQRGPDIGKQGYPRGKDCDRLDLEFWKGSKGNSRRRSKSKKMIVKHKHSVAHRPGAYNTTVKKKPALGSHKPRRKAMVTIIDKSRKRLKRGSSSYGIKRQKFANPDTKAYARGWFSEMAESDSEVSGQGCFEEDINNIDSNQGNSEEPKTLATDSEVERCLKHNLKLHQSFKISSCSSLVSGSHLIAGTNEGMIWYLTPDCTEIISCTKVAGQVASLSTWNNHVAVGSAVVQVIKTSDEQPTRVMYRKAKDRLMVPGRKHLVTFIGDSGKIATTEVGGNTIDIWPRPADTKVVMKPEASTQIDGKVLSLCAPHESENPLISTLLEKDMKLKLQVIDVNNDCNYSLSLEGDSRDCFAQYLSDRTKIAVGVGNHLQVYSITVEAGFCHISSKHFASTISCVNSFVGGLLGVGFNTGHFTCVDSNLNSTLYNCDIDDLQISNSPVVSLVLLGNKDVCVAHNDGVLQLWKVDHNLGNGNKLRQRSTLGMELHNQGIFSMPEIVECSTEEQEIAPGVYLTLPQEITDENIQVEMAFRPCGLGHASFVFPKQMVPISPAVWLCTTPERQFKEPAKLKLFHCLQNDNDEHQKRIKFLKADHNDITRGKHGEIMIHFKEMNDGQSELPTNTSYGILRDHHFCVYCLVIYYEEEQVLKDRRYCLSILKPIAYSRQKSAKIHCILSYDLPSCKKLIAEQFAQIKKGTVDYHPVPMVEKLQFDTPRYESAIELQVDRAQAQRKGWRIQVESETKIYTEDVNFFKYEDTEQLVNACTKSDTDNPYLYSYPPRFTVDVSSEYAQSRSEITLRFTGARGEHSTEIRLDILRNEQDLQYGLGSEDGGRALVEPMRHFNGTVGPY